MKNIYTPWKQFSENFKLTKKQLDQFKSYYELLCFWNKKFNLTRITKLEEVIRYHFIDSIKLTEFYNFDEINSVADVGSGAGFPGIPLKILYPHLKLILIEVSSKKIKFLEEVIKKLFLSNVEISSLDWRTFIRKTSYQIDLFCARASLPPSELVRIFKPMSPYKDAELVYWASYEWKIGRVETAFFLKQKEYHLNGIKRKYIFFRKSSMETR